MTLGSDGASEKGAHKGRPYQIDMRRGAPCGLFEPSPSRCSAAQTISRARRSAIAAVS